MLRNDDQNKDARFNLRLFNTKNSSDIEELNKIIDAELAREGGNELFNLTYSKMIDWLRIYVSNFDSIFSFKDRRYLELMAEATFWSVKLGLEPHLAKMSYSEIREFQPLSECSLLKTERSKMINEVCDKLVKPQMGRDASFALKQAALCVYLHNHSFNQLQEEERIYDSNELKLGINHNN